MAAGMARIFVSAFVLMMCGAAQAAAPQFDTEHFCADFAGSHATGSMGDMAKAVCLLSEQSTKTSVDKAWDRVSITNRDMCVKTARDSYVYLAKCLGSVQGR
jgi:hypothetical protein